MAKYAYHRLDANHQAIVEGLKAHGYSVVPIGRPVDLVVGKWGRTYLLEIKTQKGKLEPTQARFIREWRGHVAEVRTLQEALDAIMHLT